MAKQNTPLDNSSPQALSDNTPIESSISLDALNHMFTSSQLSPCWLIHGQLDKARSFAKQFAMNLLISESFKKPLSNDGIKKHVNARTYPNFYYLEPVEGETDIKVDALSEFRNWTSKCAPFEGPRVVIIDYIQIMNRFGVNSLLKVLEEPSKNLYMLILAKQLSDILPTIRSRCNNISIKHKKNHQVSQQLESVINQMLLSALAGNISQAQILLEKGLSLMPQRTPGETKLDMFVADEFATLVFEQLSSHVQTHAPHLAQVWLEVTNFWIEAKERHLDLKSSLIAILAALFEPWSLRTALD